MSQYPFLHDFHVYVIGDDNYETAYYTYEGLKYKRSRKLGEETWEDTMPIGIPTDEFLMAVACVERVRMR